MQSAQSPLVQANQAYRAGHSAAAMAGYVAAMQKMPELGQTLAANITRTRQQYLATRPPDAKPKVVICGWELAHNAAGRAHTLAEIYREFAEVEIVGSLFPRWGREVWEPMRDTSVSVDTFIADPSRFIEQAMRLVAAHPAEIVHLSKPRAPNILFGIIYKLLWQARVILDIDDEELSFVQAETPHVLASYLLQHPALPPLDQLPDTDWTRLAVGLAHEFDAITVANIALQRRYGGDIIGHARDPHTLTPSAALRQASRLAHGIRPEQKVILFAGTPRPHKGLLEVAQAIHSLQRIDILFVIAGSFGANYQSFKDQLQAVQGVSYLFLENQPLAALPSILALADCCVLMQDPGHACASFQIPAKLSDALAMRIPVIATATPALADAIAAGAVIPATLNNLASQLAAVLDQPNPRLSEAGHRYFSEHLSIAANAARLQQLLDTTASNPLTPLLRQLLDTLAEESPTLAPAKYQLIKPAHTSQAVRQTFSLVDWSAERNKTRRTGLVSIIIPIFNQPELTAACVASLYQHTSTEHFELVLVDNGSADPTQALLQNLASQHPNVRLVRNAENLNFAHGCNLGFAASQGDIVVFLNNDTIVTPHWLPPLGEALQQPGVAAVQPKLLYPDGTIQCIGVVFSTQSPLGYPIYAGRQPEHPWASRSRRFQAVTGACMALRARDFAEIQGFDPVYINGQEDIDLCLRLNELYKQSASWVAVESVVIHHESKTPNRFQHVEHNRRCFVRRWSGRVRADDRNYYATDGFSVTDYQNDSPHTLPADLQVYRATIAAT